VAIQLRETAFMEKVAPICGKARLIADPMKATKNDTKQRMKRAFDFMVQTYKNIREIQNGNDN
jgi:hypothetical protein